MRFVEPRLLEFKLPTVRAARMAFYLNSLAAARGLAVKSITMVRNLRIVAASFCLVVSLALAALWARSYFFRDTLQGPPAVFFSWRGQIANQWDKETDPINRRFNRWITNSWSNEFIELMLSRHSGDIVWPPEPSLLGFTGAQDHLGQVRICFPHWFPLMLAAALAVALKPRPRLRFSLREVLVLTTVSALAMGGVLALIRATSS